MSRRTRIPKFGSWDSSDGNAAFTEVFEVARAARTTDQSEVLAGRVRNPHPQKINPTVSHARKVSSASDEGGEGFASGYDQRTTYRQIDPPAQRILIDDSRYVPGRDDVGVLPPRVISHSQSERESVQRSPMQQGRNRSGASPAWEKKDGSSTPGRMRPKSRDAPVAEKAAVLPKFGAWDANDPASGDGFTMIFNNARNEKKAGGAALVPDPAGLEDKDLYPERVAGSNSKPSTMKSFCCFQPSVVEA